MIKLNVRRVSNSYSWPNSYLNVINDEVSPCVEPADLNSKEFF